VDPDVLLKIGSSRPDASHLAPVPSLMSNRPTGPGARTACIGVGTISSASPENAAHHAPGFRYQLGVEVATTLVRQARREWVIEGDDGPAAGPES
jgi:hypothetical protein